MEEIVKIVPRGDADRIGWIHRLVVFVKFDLIGKELKANEHVDKDEQKQEHWEAGDVSQRLHDSLQ